MAADRPLSIMEEKLGMVVYEARLELMPDLALATFEDKLAWALLAKEAKLEVILFTSERRLEAALVMAAPGLPRTEVTDAASE